MFGGDVKDMFSLFNRQILYQTVNIVTEYILDINQEIITFWENGTDSVSNSELAPYIRVLMAKPDDFSSVQRIFMAVGEN